MNKLIFIVVINIFTAFSFAQNRQTQNICRILSISGCSAFQNGKELNKYGLLNLDSNIKIVKNTAKSNWKIAFRPEKNIQYSGRDKKGNVAQIEFAENEHYTITSKGLNIYNMLSKILHQRLVQN